MLKGELSSNSGNTTVTFNGKSPVWSKANKDLNDR